MTGQTWTSWQRPSGPPWPVGARTSPSTCAIQTPCGPRPGCRASTAAPPRACTARASTSRRWTTASRNSSPRGPTGGPPAGARRPEAGLRADGWVSVLPADELPEGQAARVWAEGIRLIVGRPTAGEAPFAALDSCPHLDLPLAAFGRVELRRGRIVCPWHFWEFDAGTGRCEYAAM